MNLENAPSCYLSVRIKNRHKANDIRSQLQDRGVRVYNPCDITPVGIPPSDFPRYVAEACYAMMEKSSSTVLIAGSGDDFGRDCSTELGYTVAARKPVYILVDEGKLPVARGNMALVLPRHVFDFSDTQFFDSVDSLALTLSVVK